ncbi:MAG: trypsin-like peptidase domain-containing protein [Bacteroidetes bacterium]|nr:trypsin-like peptidase domain-containing protein [Bacteroidota bacterium]
MEEIVMMDTIERYAKGEMLPEEKHFFEELRKSSPELDQLVIDHLHFLNKIDEFGQRKALDTTLNAVHNKLSSSGDIKDVPTAKVIGLWKKYRKVVLVAASIAGITALAISSLISFVTPKPDNKSILQLRRELRAVQVNQTILNNQINEIKPKIPEDVKMKYGGTGFLIDGKGYLVTNEHVVDNARAVIVQNNKGEEFKAKILHIDRNSDLAILKIDDNDFKPYGSLPYSISKSSADLGEQIFTLGFPRDEIVYGEGYMSAKTGFDGDTLACQIAVAANPGNSGAPVLNKNGEIIGVLSARQIQAQGVVFAIKSKNIYKLVDSLKTDTSYASVKTPSNSLLKGMDRVQQIKKIQDCIFIVKSY